MAASKLPAGDPGARGRRIFASPVSRAIARREGLDLSGLQGSGPQGRILQADVLAALGESSGGPGTTAHGARARETDPGAMDGVPFREVPHSFSRKLIARRLTESKQRAPHFYARIDCDLDRVMALRAAAAGGEGGLRLSVNDFVLHAAAHALRDVPEVNASYTETGVRRFERVHIAVAVALEDGLVTPVLQDADRKSVAQIAGEVKDLATRARNGTLGPGASSGGTFSVSNLGSHGVREFAAVINPPQAAILAVGAAEQRAAVRAGRLEIATMMTVTLSVDHRAVDGAVAARWLAAFRQRIEDPVPSHLQEAPATTAAGAPP